MKKFVYINMSNGEIVEIKIFDNRMLAVDYLMAEADSFGYDLDDVEESVRTQDGNVEYDGGEDRVFIVREED